MSDAQDLGRDVMEFSETARSLLEEVAEAYDAGELEKAAQLSHMATAHLSMAQLALMRIQVEKMAQYTQGTRQDGKSLMAMAAELFTASRRPEDHPEG